MSRGGRHEPALTLRPNVEVLENYPSNCPSHPTACLRPVLGMLMATYFTAGGATEWRRWWLPGVACSTELPTVEEGVRKAVERKHCQQMSSCNHLDARADFIRELTTTL